MSFLTKLFKRKPHHMFGYMTDEEIRAAGKEFARDFINARKALDRVEKEGK